MRRSLYLFLMFVLVVTLQGQTPAKTETQSLGLNHATFIVKLTAPISTRTSNPGDTFAALVESPSEYQGAVFSGRITKLSAPKKGTGKGKPQISFQFESLTIKDVTYAVLADIRDVANSKGVKSVDEEGQVLGKTSNKKRVASAATGAAIGTLIGALAGGAQGAAMGGAAGLAAGLAIGLTMTSAGSQLEFLPGSHFTLDVTDRNTSRVQQTSSREQLPVPAAEQVSGTYVNQANASEVLELKADGTFSLVERGRAYSGTYRLNGHALLLRVGRKVATGVLTDNTIKDTGGKIWVKRV